MQPGATPNAPTLKKDAVSYGPTYARTVRTFTGPPPGLARLAAAG